MLWFRSEIICVCENKKNIATTFSHQDLALFPPFFSCLNSCEQHRSAPQKLESHKIFFFSFRLSSYKSSHDYKCLNTELSGLVHNTKHQREVCCRSCSVLQVWVGCCVIQPAAGKKLRRQETDCGFLHSSKCNTLKVLLKRKQRLKADLYLLLASSRESCRSEHSIQSRPVAGLPRTSLSTADQGLQTINLILCKERKRSPFGTEMFH